jgi:hypothetical protein
LFFVFCFLFFVLFFVLFCLFGVGLWFKPYRNRPSIRNARQLQRHQPCAALAAVVVGAPLPRMALLGAAALHATTNKNNKNNKNNAHQQNNKNNAHQHTGTARTLSQKFIRSALSNTTKQVGNFEHLTFSTSHPTSHSTNTTTRTSGNTVRFTVPVVANSTRTKKTRCLGSAATLHHRQQTQTNKQTKQNKKQQKNNKKTTKTTKTTKKQQKTTKKNPKNNQQTNDKHYQVHPSE